MNNNYINAKVLENEEISSNIYKLIIEGSFQGEPGQFYMLRAWNMEPMLSRPISINYISKDKIIFYYQKIGKGTEIFANLKKQDNISLLGPLGNGFLCKDLGEKVAIITGGIGIAPMLYTAEAIKKNCSVKIDLYSGFRDEAYLVHEMSKLVDNMFITTEDGSVGKKGYITEIFKPEDYSTVLCCGPEPMMNKVIEACKLKGVPLYVTLEKHMACGVGACLVCTCKTKQGNLRTCKDGPVFKGEDIII